MGNERGKMERKGFGLLNRMKKKKSLYAWLFFFLKNVFCVLFQEDLLFSSEGWMIVSALGLLVLASWRKGRSITFV